MEKLLDNQENIITQILDETRLILNNLKNDTDTYIGNGFEINLFETEDRGDHFWHTTRPGVYDIYISKDLTGDIRRTILAHEIIEIIATIEGFEIDRAHEIATEHQNEL